jgi:hypothetical protein
MVTDNEIMNQLKKHLQLEEDEKYEKELIECTENMTEISQECKDYFKEKFESDYDKLHTSDAYMDTYMGPIDE